MLSRRTAKRFRVTEPAKGTMLILREVIVQRNGEDEWIAISREAVAVGDTLLLDVFDMENGELQHRYTVWVIESRPVVVDGDVRHRIRLYTGEMAPALFEQPLRRS
jgi:hypothetical protein